MATNKQRRDSERLRLQRQLEERRRREAARKRATLIGSIVGTLVVIAVVVLVVALTVGNDDGKDAAAAPSSTRSPSTSAASSAAASSPSVPAECQNVATLSGAVSFQGVTVGNAKDLKKEPKVCSSSKTDPAKLAVKDLVVGKGKAPALTSTVKVQYTGVLYKAGTQFDSSWVRGQAASFSLQGVIPGFTQAIGGNAQAGIAPMKIGGRRIVVVPSALGYGATGSPPTIPANTALVFVIDLLAVS